MSINIRISGNKKAEIIECADILDWADNMLSTIEGFVQEFTAEKVTTMGELPNRGKYVEIMGGTDNRPINPRTQRAVGAMIDMRIIITENPDYDVYPIVSIVGNLVDGMKRLRETISTRIQPSCDTDEIDNNIESLLNGTFHISEFVTFEGPKQFVKDFLYIVEPIVSFNDKDRDLLISEMKIDDPYPIHMTTDDLDVFEKLCSRIKDMRDQILKVYSDQ